MKCFWMAASILALVAAGCGGGGSPGTPPSNFGQGTVRGIVFDEQGNPVRDAHVFFDDGFAVDRRDTTSNSNGVYELSNVPVGDDLLNSEVTQGNGHFVGANTAQILKGVTVMNINLVLYPDSQIAGIQGTVYDRQGHLISNATVSIKQASANTVLTSNYGITDSRGHYSIPVLKSNLTYNVQSNVVGYDSDVDTITLATGENRRLDFTLPIAANLGLGTPTHVVATAWTSPKTGRSPGFASVKENMKKLILRARYRASRVVARDTANSFIEVDLTWDPVQNTHLLGYGIYRARSGQPLAALDFAQDPLAEFYGDMDPSLFPGNAYSYGVTTVTGSSSESPMSPTVAATPLGDMTLNNVSGGSQPQFSWTSAFGADHYSAYLFADFPALGAIPIWDTSKTPTTRTSVTYNGAPLSRGHTYYLIVVGQSVAGSNSISPIGQFVD